MVPEAAAKTSCPHSVQLIRYGTKGIFYPAGKFQVLNRTDKRPEAARIVLLQVLAGRLGSPSEVAADPLLATVSPEAEQFHHAEERRAIYVAILPFHLEGQQPCAEKSKKMRRTICPGLW